MGKKDKGAKKKGKGAEKTAEKTEKKIKLKLKKNTGEVHKRNPAQVRVTSRLPACL